MPSTNTKLVCSIWTALHSNQFLLLYVRFQLHSDHQGNQKIPFPHLISYHKINNPHTYTPQPRKSLAHCINTWNERQRGSNSFVFGRCAGCVIIFAIAICTFSLSSSTSRQPSTQSCLRDEWERSIIVIIVTNLSATSVKSVRSTFRVWVTSVSWSSIMIPYGVCFCARVACRWCWLLC